MNITITAATGHLGRLVIDELLSRGVPAANIVAAVRTPAKAADLAARGIQVREADYDRLETLRTALAGTDRLLFISGSEAGSRLAQHRNVVDAAAAVAVPSVAYTSILKADTSGVSLAVEHKATEELLAASGIPTTLLRNSWYLENYTEHLAPTLEHGALVGAAGDGLVSAASRADYAAAAAAVLTGDGHEGTIYELGGDTAFTLSDLAAAITDVTGTPVTYTDLPAAQLVRVLSVAGLPEPVAQMLASADEGIARGDLHTTTGDLSRLIGRPTTTAIDALRLAVKG